MTECILLEIAARPTERRRGRRNPRVVKRKMSNFPTKARATPACQGHSYEDHIQIVVPAKPTSSPCSTVARETATRKFWLHHVSAWWGGNLSRAAYCQRHDLDPRTFHQWVARLRHRFRRPIQDRGRKCLSQRYCG